MELVLYVQFWKMRYIDRTEQCSATLHKNVNVALVSLNNCPLFLRSRPNQYAFIKYIFCDYFLKKEER